MRWYLKDLYIFTPEHEKGLGGRLPLFCSEGRKASKIIWHSPARTKVEETGVASTRSSHSAANHGTAHHSSYGVGGCGFGGF